LPDCQLALAANGRGRLGDSVKIIRLLKFSAAFPADAALVRPSSMNNHVVDCISDEYDAAAWIDPSEQLFARRVSQLPPIRPVPLGSSTLRRRKG
jgi:hypothetical protein